MDHGELSHVNRQKIDTQEVVSDQRRSDKVDLCEIKCLGSSLIDFE